MTASGWNVSWLSINGNRAESPAHRYEILSQRHLALPILLNNVVLVCDKMEGDLYSFPSVRHSPSSLQKGSLTRQNGKQRAPVVSHCWTLPVARVTLLDLWVEGLCYSLKRFLVSAGAVATSLPTQMEIKLYRQKELWTSQGWFSGKHTRTMLGSKDKVWRGTFQWRSLQSPSVCCLAKAGRIVSHAEDLISKREKKKPQMANSMLFG